MLHDGADEIDIVAKALYLKPVKRRDLQVGGLIAGCPPSDQLRDHGVIEYRNFTALGHTIIDADAVDAAQFDSSKPLPFRGGVGVGLVRLVLRLMDRPHPRPLP